MGGHWGNCAVVPPPGPRDHVLVPSSTDNQSVGWRSAGGWGAGVTGEEEYGKGVRRDGGPLRLERESPSASAQACREGEKVHGEGGEPVTVPSSGEEAPGPAHLRAAQAAPTAEAPPPAPPPPQPGSATGFPVALPALYRLYFLYLFKT